MAVLPGNRPTRGQSEELVDPAVAAQQADYSIFEDLHVEYGTLDMARELVQWTQH